MLVRPRDLADQMSGEQHQERFTLPLEAARCKAREIIDQAPRGGLVRPSRNGANSPTVKLNLRYGIFRLGIDPKIAAPPPDQRLREARQ